MPPIGLALGNVDFANLFVNLPGKDYPPVLSLSDSDQGDALRALHVRVEVNRLGAVRQMLEWKTRCRDPTLLADSLRHSKSSSWQEPAAASGVYLQ